ncbi:MAG: hypothetical protein LQ340_001329 [Diploschistes diacapsis]|nr:MAG: hypothetical protein LQ340_001329 [Diploschistes diacapsis]
MPKTRSIIARAGAIIDDETSEMNAKRDTKMSLRQLVHDGAPGDRLFGADIEPGFWDLGYELFCDRAKFRGRFVGASLLDEDAVILLREAVEGSVDIMYLGSVLHLWDWEDQARAVRTIIALTRPGSQFFGAQIGRVTGTADRTGWDRGSKAMFFHDTHTLQQLWTQVGTETKSEWRDKSELADNIR